MLMQLITGSAEERRAFVDQLKKRGDEKDRRVEQTVAGDFAECAGKRRQRRARLYRKIRWPRAGTDGSVQKRAGRLPAKL